MQTVQLEHIDNEAREWFTLMQSGAVTELQQQQLEQWLSESNAHRKAYHQYEIIWQDLGTLATSQEAFSLKNSIKIGFFTRIQILLQQAVQHLLSGSGVGNKFHATGIAIIAIAVVGALFITLKRDPVNITQYATQTAEIKTITLADGSQITLGAKSEIKTWTTTNERHVVLINGQAFFKVTKDPQRAFFVNAEDTLVKVVGTRFDVRKGAGNIRVAVEEGTVNVFNAPAAKNNAPTAFGSPIVLTANQQVTYLHEEGFTDINTISATELEAWRNGRLVYQRASLADVIADANRYTKNPITLASKKLADLKVTAAVSTDQMDGLPDMLAKSLPIEINREADNRIAISPRKNVAAPVNNEK